MPSTLSSNYFINEEDFQIYPNPASDYFKLTNNSDEILIYDLFGKVVKKYKGNFSNEKQFDISKLKSGVYIISTFLNNSIKNHKLIKL